MEAAYKALVKQLGKDYSLRESRRITDLIFEKMTGYSPTIRLMKKKDELKDSQMREFRRCTDRLLHGQPVQYVLEEAWFYGMCFYVNPSVLIPRPETEELVEWILTEIKDVQGIRRILDVGTGSGCIPIALKKNNPNLSVWAIDKYAAALDVARKNAHLLKTDIRFLKWDLFDSGIEKVLPEWDVIVSNPPYIPRREKVEMDRHVVEHEPQNALFVPDDDALIFYKEILHLAEDRLKIGGMVFVEIHEDLGSKVCELFESKLSNVILKKDMSGKDRMLFGQKL